MWKEEEDRFVEISSVLCIFCVLGGKSCKSYWQVPAGKTGKFSSITGNSIDFLAANSPPPLR